MAVCSPVPGPLHSDPRVTFNGPAATDTQFDTVEINRQYDGFSDYRCIRSISSPC